jgi:hypothetical protein
LVVCARSTSAEWLHIKGELVSSDEKQFPLSGALFGIRVEGMTPPSMTVLPCNAQLNFTEFEISNNQVTHLFGRVAGRCGGSLAGTFVLRRM